MNKIFKIVWNAARGKMMVVNEATSSVQTGKKVAVTVAATTMMLFSGATMAANTPWFDETEDIVHTTPVPLKPDTTEVSTAVTEDFEAAPNTETVTQYALFGEWNGSDITVNNTTAALTVTDQVKEEGETTTPITASVISVENIVANLTGDSVKLSVDNQTTQGSARFVKSAAVLVSEFEEGGTLNVSAAESQFDAKTVSGSLAGISLECGGTLNMTGNVVNINAESSVDELPVVYDEWDSRYRVAGLQFDGANAVKTSDNTALNISVTGTGETQYAADVIGIEGEHDGGEVYFGGATTVVTESNAGSNVGIYLATVSTDESDEFGPSNVIFNGKTTVEVTAQNAEYAVGLSVGLSDEAIEDIPEEVLTGSNSLGNTVSFNNGIDITVSNGGEDTIGINVGNEYEIDDTSIHVLNIKGDATVNATGAQDAYGVTVIGSSEANFNDGLKVNATLNFNPAHIDADWTPDEEGDVQNFGAAAFIAQKGAKASLLGNVTLDTKVVAPNVILTEMEEMEAAGIYFDQADQMTIGSEGKTVAITVSMEGINGTSAGIYVERGSTDSNSQIIVNAPTTITASSDTKAIGVLIGESGSVKFNDALKVTSNSETESIGLSLKDVTSSVAFNKGDSLIKAGKALESTGVVDIASEAKVTFDGSISLAEGGAINVADKAQLMVKNNVESTIAGQINSGDALKGEIAFAGGKLNLAQNAGIAGNTVAFEDIEVHQQGQIKAGESIRLGNGTVWYEHNQSSFKSPIVYFGEGSQFLTDNIDEDIEGYKLTTLYAAGDGKTHYWQGGTFARIDYATDQKTAFTDFEVGSDNSSLYVQAAYAFNTGLVENDTQNLYIETDKGHLTVNSLEMLSGNVYVRDGGTLTVEALKKTGGTFEVQGGQVTALTLDLTSPLVLKSDGLLTTLSNQVFTSGLAEDGLTLSADALTTSGQNISFQGGTLAINDEFYNLTYAQNAGDLLAEGHKLVFNGKVVEAELKGEQNIEDIPDDSDVVHSQLDVTVGSAKDEQGNDVAEVDKNFGASSIKVDSTVDKVVIADGKTVTLVGGDNKELFDFGEEATGKEIEVKGSLEVGHEGSTSTSGKVSHKVTIADYNDGEKDVRGKLNVNHGNYHFDDVDLNGGDVEVKGKSNVSFKNIEVAKGKDARVDVGESAEATIDKVKGHGANLYVHNGNDKRALKVKEMHLGDENASTDESKTTITGKVEVANLQGHDKAVMHVGTADDGNSKRGDVKLGKDSKLNGMTIFMDPVWVDGMTTADASRLILESTNVDGKIVVGHNSYAVLGGSDDSAFLDVAKKHLTWGEKGTLAAAYVAQPITIADNGSLYLDGSLKSLDSVTVPTGSVIFKGTSVLVADATQAGDKPLITASTIDIENTAKAVIVGKLDASKTYQLTDATTTNDSNDNFANVVSGNAMWKVNVGQDGTFQVKLQDASMIYGDSMQGAQLANGGMQAGGASEEYVNSLLTDTSGNISALPSVAARFDAAMNPAGALATFTTAYDRANDLRQVVREEANLAEGTRLWAHISGSDIALKDLSTGGQSLDVDTKAYGLVIGGEAKLDKMTVGMALTAGSGDTENDAVAAKDDFDYYGFSVYAKTMVGGVDVLADASVTMLKSDMTVGGVADVDTEADTTVYSLGVQAQKTFAFQGVDVTPFVGMDVYHVRADGYSNGHGAEVADADATAVEMPIGVTIAKGFETAGGMKIDPTFTFAVVPTLGGSDIDSKVKFAGAESTYNFTYADDVKVRSKLGVQATKKNFNFGISAGYEWGSEDRSTTSIKANVKYMF